LPLSSPFGRLDAGVAPAALCCGGVAVLRTMGRGAEGTAQRTLTSGEDQRIQCVDCGEEFLFTAGEQAFYREHNLTHAPTRCKRCRANRKGARSADDAPAPRPPDGPSARELHRAVCSNCGSETRVPFVPTASR